MLPAAAPYPGKGDIGLPHRVRMSTVPAQACRELGERSRCAPGTPRRPFRSRRMMAPGRGPPWCGRGRWRSPDQRGRAGTGPSPMRCSGLATTGTAHEGGRRDDADGAAGPGGIERPGGLGGFFPPLVMGATYDPGGRDYLLGLLLLCATAWWRSSSPPCACVATPRDRRASVRGKARGSMQTPARVRVGAHTIPGMLGALVALVVALVAAVRWTVGVRLSRTRPATRGRHATGE